ncbi:hypothetical protein A7C99_6422 [Trichophyton rubrum]|uniref:Uncharacterized protein n=1 Tax=Trichophyton rubrum TaxID=5551 RepID=A0A178EP61_TRIRU|nr:hypothetical protein A7C99_6422 [Trichophyton rubrum]
MGTRQAEAALDKVGFFLTSNTGLGDMERHDACPMAANSCFIPRTILYNTLFEIIGLLSPFCAALVSRPRWNPRAAAISPALIHNCNTYDIPTRYTPPAKILVRFPNPLPSQKPETVAEDPCPNFTSSRVADWGSDMPTFGLGTAREQAMELDERPRN